MPPSRHACKELGLPSFGWDGANPNVLVDGINGTDPGWGSAPMRGFLAKVYKVGEGELYIQQPDRPSVTAESAFGDKVFA